MVAPSLPPPVPVRQDPARAPIDLGVFRLLFKLSAVPVVRAIRAAGGRDSLHVWVLVDREDPKESGQLYLLEREYHKLGDAFPVDLEVVPLDQVDERNLPPAETIYTRPA